LVLFHPDVVPTTFRNRKGSYVTALMRPLAPAKKAKEFLDSQLSDVS
jgi:hypothetical protein